MELIIAYSNKIGKTVTGFVNGAACHNIKNANSSFFPFFPSLAQQLCLQAACFLRHKLSIAFLSILYPQQHSEAE